MSAVSGIGGQDVGQVIWSTEASQQLDEIFNYIAQDNPAAAHRVIDGILGSVQSLESFPELGRRYARPGRNVRFIIHRNYRIAYRIHRNRDVVILFVRHTSRNFPVTN